MKYSEFYKLIEQHGWTIKKGKGHYKYVQSRLSLLYSGRQAQDPGGQAGHLGQDAENGRDKGTEMKELHQELPASGNGAGLIGRTNPKTESV